jgi:predicted nucleotidyltransferase
MENIKQENILPENVLEFFNELRRYLDTKIYYFGSIQRNDFFPGSSDIDVDIFTDNEQSTIVKMQHFLQVKKKDFKKIVWRLNVNNRVAQGHKIMYKNPELGVSVEISIYNEIYKEGILKEHKNKIILPFYASWMLIVLKYVYYNLKWMEKKTFAYWKKKILTLGIGLPDDEFIVLHP